MKPILSRTSASARRYRALAALITIAGVAILTPRVQAQTNGVSVVFSRTGLSSLQYQGTEYLGDGEFRLNRVEFMTSTGIQSGSIAGSCAMNAGNGQLTCSYPWGSVISTYSVSGNRLNLSIGITNSTSNPLTGIFLEPLAIRFPQKPSEYNGNTPILGSNIGEPTVLKMTFGTRALALVDEGTAPLLSGFPFAADRPGAMRLFPLRLNTGVEPTYPDSLPRIERAIAPGGNDTYRLSIRFGTAAMTKYDFAADVYAQFAKIHKFRLNWPDRRPIASLILGTTATDWPTNPRGWLLDPTIDVRSARGVKQLHDRVMQWADDSIAIMRRMNAQGMITWDLEGEQYPQPTTYIGDPRVFAELAPEMSGIADAYFQKFRDAGFRVGICIRPQHLKISGGKVTQSDIADPTELLAAKIAYARNRWGATLFYVDSNGDANNPISAAFFEKVAAAWPHVLLIPEHETLAYYGSTAPYRELRLGCKSSPPVVRKIYPRGFSVINTADGDVDGNREELKQAVAHGDILMFRGWFDDPVLVKIRGLYSEGSASTGLQ